MRLDFEQLPSYRSWASAVLCVRFDDNVRTIASVREDGRVAAVLVYSRFHQYSVEMTIATDGSAHWMPKEGLFQAFAYPFYILHKRRVNAIIAADNHKSLSLARRLGFVEEGCLRNWFGEKDGIALGMLKEECKWLRQADRNRNG